MVTDGEERETFGDYPYHTHRYFNAATRTIETLPCKHCKPGVPCSECRGTFDRFPGSDASMFIQWKGTDVCMDFHCECGYHSHIDADFAYAVECAGCGALYEMGTQVRARRMPDEEVFSWGNRAKVRDTLDMSNAYIEDLRDDLAKAVEDDDGG